MSATVSIGAEPLADTFFGCNGLDRNCRWLNESKTWKLRGDSDSYELPRAQRRYFVTREIGQVLIEQPEQVFVLFRGVDSPRFAGRSYRGIANHERVIGRKGKTHDAERDQGGKSGVDNCSNHRVPGH